MTFERIVGLHVTDDAAYARYREAMMPMLQKAGGGFRYDFKVTDLLRSDTDKPINRVFAIYCPDKKAMETLFADEKYVAIKTEHFSPSVSATTLIAQYER